MLWLLFRKPGEHFTHRALKFSVILSGLGSVNHFKQSREILFVLRGLVPNVADQGGVEKPFGLF